MIRFLFIVTTIILANSSLANSFKTEDWITSNGVKVIFYEAREVPMLDISLAFAAGSAFDQKNYGLSSLTAHLLNEGSVNANANALAEALAETGAQYDLVVSRDMVNFNLRTLTTPEPLRNAVSTFAEIINHPIFPVDSLERVKKQFLMAILQTQESPDELATQLFFQKLYGEHPYAHPVNGTKETISEMNQQQVKAFYKNHYLANNAVLVLVGAIDSKTAHALANQITKELPQGPKAAPINKAKPLMKSEQVNVPYPSSQTVVRLGQLGIDYQNPQYFSLIVGNYILGGGGLVSRLAVEVRDKNGLTYNIDSQFVPMPGPGPFFIGLSTKNTQTKETIHRTQSVLKHFVTRGPSQEELDAAKKYLSGSFPMSLSSNRSIAALLIRIRFFNLPSNYLDTYLTQVNKVSVKDIKTAFQQQVHPEKLLMVTVGKS